MNVKTVAASAFMACALVACNGHSPEYNELAKNGVVREAQIYEIDSADNVCKYRLVVGEKEYYGHCKQRSGSLKPFEKDEVILVVYLQRDPSINRRLSDQ